MFKNKTQQTQYAEDDNHPVHTKTFGHCGVVLGGDSANRIIK